MCLYVFLNEYYTGTIFFFSNEYQNFSLCIYFTLFTLTALAFKLHIWFYLLSLLFSKSVLGLASNMYYGLLVVLPITPDGPCLALNNPSTRGSDSTWNACEGTFCSMTQIYHWFLERSGISNCSWKARWSEKMGTKEILSSLRDAGSLIIWTITIIIMIYQGYLFWNS